MESLKGMNKNHLTALPDFDYRFLVVLITSIFTTDELSEGCVKVKPIKNNGKMLYKLLDAHKMAFVEGKAKNILNWHM